MVKMQIGAADRCRSYFDNRVARIEDFGIFDGFDMDGVFAFVTDGSH
jgi:hypothetical protein